MHPFLQFPQFTYLSFFVPTLLRVAAAIIIAHVAYIQWTRRDAIAQTRLPFLGKNTWWAPLSATALFAGYYAQVAAIFGAAAAFKHAIFHKKYPTPFPLGHSAYFLLFVICISIIITGAGAFALDLPL